MKKAILYFAVISAGLLTACSSSDKDSKISQEDFDATQPVVSGTYESDYFDIIGQEERKGHFDGRVMFSLSPETSVIYVYENGNRTKIDYLVVLDKPFEKISDDKFEGMDKDGNNVTVTTDSIFKLTFEKKDSKITLNFNEKPLSTQQPADVLTKIYDMKGL